MILLNFRNIALIRNSIPRQNNLYCLNRFIETSSRDSQSSITLDNNPKTVRKTRKNYNWQSYGFDYIDQRNDIFWMHATSFFLITVLFWGGFLILTYYPDIDDKDWIQREAYIQLRRREVLGLPLVDKNYVDPATVLLPPDEELGDDDIII